jgi:hypothetical protein
MNSVCKVISMPIDWKRVSNRLIQGLIEDTHIEIRIRDIHTERNSRVTERKISHTL